jgi:hypothetical protein
MPRDAKQVGQKLRQPRAFHLNGSQADQTSGKTVRAYVGRDGLRRQPSHPPMLKPVERVAIIFG